MRLRLNSLAFVFAALLACDSGSTSETADKADKKGAASDKEDAAASKAAAAITELENARDEACSCKGENCLWDTSQVLAKWQTKWSDLAPSTEDKARIDTLTKEFEDCQQKSLLDDMGIQPSEPEVVAKVIEELQALTDTACACKDVKCRADAMKSLEAWADKNSHVHGTDADTKKVEELGEKAGECMGRQ